MGLIPLPDIKDYWSSDRKTQIKFFGDACGEMIPPNTAIGPAKG
jgi:hypothetical protein